MEILYFAAWAGKILVFVLVAILGGAVWVRLKTKTSSMHMDIPDREEMRVLWDAILQAPDMRTLTVPRHHRGAIYWHAKGSGFTTKDALELALTPEASAVEYDIIEVEHAGI